VLGEKWLGLDREVRHMIYMFSGVGVGILVNGEIYRGATGAAGELGIASPKETRDEAYQIATQLGRWEMDLGMAAAARQALKKGEKSLLSELAGGDPAKIGFKELVRAVKEKDPLAARIVEQGGAVLGRKVAFLTNLLNPEIVVIGGGVEDCGAPFLEALKNTVKEWSVEEASSRVSIIPSAFGENAVALGAVGIVAREIFAQI